MEQPLNEPQITLLSTLRDAGIVGVQHNPHSSAHTFMVMHKLADVTISGQKLVLTVLGLQALVAAEAGGG